MVALRLKEIVLPAGNIRGVNIGWFKDASELVLDWHSWIAEGFDGVRIRGAGVDKTVITADLYDGNAVCIGRHPGVVELKDLTVAAGFSMGIQCGEQNLSHELLPKFQLRLINVKGTCSQIPGFGRTKWWCFSYQCDVFIDNVEVDGTQLSEHDFYFHNWARYGLFVRNLKCRASGAQNLKARCSADETAYAGAQAKIHIEKSQFQRAGQPWSDRGDGLIVIEGGAAIIEIEDSIFRASAPSSPHAHAVMLSSEANSYDWATGKVGIGTGNGPVSIKRIAANGWLPNPWNNELVRCARNGGSQLTTPSFLLEDSGIFGANMYVKAGQVPKGKTVVKGCNTPEIIERCNQLGGFDTQREAMWPGPTRLIPISEGIVV